jgi:hypothetical protein
MRIEARVFVPDNTFQPSPIFAFKAGSYTGSGAVKKISPRYQFVEQNIMFFLLL